MGAVNDAAKAGTTSKNALRKARRALKEARECYCKARSALLALDAGASIIKREDSVSKALEARRWYQMSKAHLARLEACDVIPHGGLWSPTALKRNGF